MVVRRPPFPQNPQDIPQPVAPWDPPFGWTPPRPQMPRPFDRWGGGMGPWDSCPHPDEEILLADDSWIKAKDIRTGDKVKTLTAEGFKEGEYEITHAEIVDNQPRCEVFFKDSKSIISSYSHPYAVEDKGFVDAKDLEVGDHVGDLIVTDTKPLDWGPVVSLSVDKAETYMLKGGSEDKPVAVLSHNKTIARPPTPPKSKLAEWIKRMNEGEGSGYSRPPPWAVDRKPRKDLLQWLRRKKGGIGGLRRKLLNVPFFEGRQFPTGIPEQFRQLPFGPPTMQPMVPFPQERATVVPRDLEQPAPVEQFGGTVVPRGLEDMMMYPGGTPGFYDDGRNLGNFDQDLFNQMPMPSLTPEEITQQRIDQVSQFEQEPMTGGDRLANIFGSLGTRYGAFGGSATNLPDYTTRTSRYPVVDCETIRPEGGHPLRFADAKFDPQRIGYADTGMRSDGDRPYALPGGYAGGGIAELLRYYGR